MALYTLINTTLYYGAFILGFLAINNGNPSYKYWIIGLIIMNFISRGAIKVAAHRVAKGERSSATLEILSHLGFMIALIAISFVALWR